MVVMLNVGARVQGRRMVHHVLAVDLNKSDPENKGAEKEEGKNDSQDL